MDSSLTPPGGDSESGLARKLRRRERLLGALVGQGGFPADQLADLDFLMVPADLLGRLQGLGEVPVVALVDSPRQVSGARAAGVFGVVGADGLEGSPTDSVDAIVSGRGRVRWARSPIDARAAFATGAEVVVYDLPAMLETLIGTLPAGRPLLPPLSDGAGVGLRQPMVLLSGMLGDASVWDALAELLSDVVVPCPARIDLDDSVPEMAASVLAQAPARFALVAHSLGAIVALEIMRRAPGRVTRLALLNASGRAPSPAQCDAWATWRQRTEDGEFDDVAAELALATLPATRRDDEVLVRTNRKMAQSVGADGFVRQLSAQATRPDSLASVGAITVPVLVMSGELDEVCPPALQRELVDHCSMAELVTLPGGHMLPIEAPGPLAEHLRRWLTVR